MCASLREPPVGGFRMVAGLRLFVDEDGDGSSRVVFLPGAGSMGLDPLPLHERLPDVDEPGLRPSRDGLESAGAAAA